MRRSTIGWIFVLVQAVLLTALILLPSGTAWSGSGAVRGAGFAAIVAGLVLIGVASLRLGSALTPTPVPTSSGQLQTGGLYRFVRHPIYSGVLLIVVGLTIRSASFVTLAVSIVTVIFFDRKANWEEQQLRNRYPGYDAYATRTPRFVPGFTPRRRPDGI